MSRVVSLGNGQQRKVVLVTGGAGYLGSHIVWALVDAGEPVVILDRFSQNDEKKDDRRKLLPKSVPLFEGDIQDESLVRTILERYDIDVVIHTAASVGVGTTPHEQLQHYENNVFATWNFLQLVGVFRRVILTSSAAVYGEPAEVPIGEMGRRVPTTTYGRSKLLAEDLVTRRSYYDPQWRVFPEAFVILRCFNIAGADPQGRTGPKRAWSGRLAQAALYSALRAGCKNSLPVSINGTDYPTRDGTCIRDYVHVSDVAAAHVAALKFMRLPSDDFPHRSLILNVGSGEGHTNLEVVRAAEQATSTKLPLEFRNRREGDVASSVADIGRIKEQLAWQPTYDLDAMIKHEFAWMQSRGW